MEQVALVAVEGAAFHYDRLFSYRIPSHLEGRVFRGIRVLVPFGRGNKKLQGLVFSVDYPQALPDYPLKSVLAPIDESPVLSEEGFAILEFMADTTFCGYFCALKCLLPAGLGGSASESYLLARQVPDEEKAALTASEREALAAVVSAETQKQADKYFTEGDAALRRKAAQSLVEKGILHCEDIYKQRVGAKTIRMVRLSPEADLDTIKLTSKQQEVVRVLRESGVASEKEAAYHAGVKEGVLRTLIKKGVITCFEREIYRIPKGREAGGPPLAELELSPEQQQAFEGIRALCQKDEANAALLFGVTGSGKTQVFVKLIEDCLARGRQAMLLVPEISLTPQMLAKFRGLFGEKIAVLHSGLSIGERLDEYRRIQEGRAQISIGTRSSIFAPFSRLGLIILDEEGEHSYKSDITPRYHARDIAKFRCVWHKATLLLASATPSVESFYAASVGKYALFTLQKRYGAAALPDVSVIDMKEEEQNGNFSPLSDQLGEELLRTWQKGEQSIVLINRRGYAAFAFCTDCGEPVRCPNCTVTLTYHRANGRLMCHYCGYTAPADIACPSCGGLHLNMVGNGTQKIEDILAKSIPGARILRMDTDTASGRYAYEEKFAQFEAGQYDILIGTQMVAKGLNFPNVTLVGVLGSDQALYSGDFRGGERTFSLITQVVGRSGRGSKPGSAYIQTISPNNEVIQAAARQDYEAFYRQEISMRKAALQPPFCDLAVVGFAGASEEQTRQAAEKFHNILQKQLADPESALPVILLGVSQAMVYRVNGRYRYRIVIKCRNNKRFRQRLRRAFAEAVQQKLFGRVTVFVDMNGEIL